MTRIYRLIEWKTGGKFVTTDSREIWDMCLARYPNGKMDIAAGKFPCPIFDQNGTLVAFWDEEEEEP